MGANGQFLSRDRTGRRAIGLDCIAGESAPSDSDLYEYAARSASPMV
jgi:hypothetical protein